jgi:glutamate formiminotransferase/formiminotetrahydrofolate cyclodeaminase
VIGARGVLVAFNVNLDTASAELAREIAAEVREKGRPPDIPGTLKACKAIGWYIREYGIAQVSLNLIDLTVTPMHRAFEEVCRRAEARGVRVTGSELIGLVPKRALTDAGRHFLKKQHRPADVPEQELIRVAIRCLGLDDLKPFAAEERVLEYRLAAPPGR